MTNYNGETVLKCLDLHAASNPDEVLFVDRKNGENICTSFRQAQDTVTAIAKSLTYLFQNPDHKISILSKNRAHWMMADLGIMRAGNVTAPVFTTMPPKTFSYAVEFAEIELIFVGEAGNWNRVKDFIPSHVKIVTFPGVELAEADYSFDEFLKLGDETPLPAHPDPEKLATLIFTSGTTGMPKGVMHSLKSLYIVIKDVIRCTDPQTSFFSYLPLAHFGDRAVNSLLAVQCGARLTFPESLETFRDDLRATAPTMFLGVPRIYEKLTQAIIAEFADDAEDLKAKLADLNGEALVTQIKESLGFQNVDFLMASTAPTPKAIKELWTLMDLPLYDAYGMTEGLPITSVGRNDPNLSGVGKPGAIATIKISSQGEILCKSPCQAIGYYKNPDATASTFVDGWLHTGDKGHIDDQGYLHISGRLKDTFKTAKGKYIAPVPIEISFSRSHLIEQLCLYGYGLTQPIMLCCLAEAASEDKITVERELKKFTRTLNQKLEPHERIGAIIICQSPWSVENGILTHTLKVKRDKVAEEYMPLIEVIAKELTVNSQKLLLQWSP